MSKAKLAIALSALSVAIVAWAVPIKGIAHQRVEPLRAADVVAPIRLKDERGRGLLAQGWINGAGPFVFVIDTGAGVSLINRSVVDQCTTLGIQITSIVGRRIQHVADIFRSGIASFQSRSWQSGEQCSRKFYGSRRKQFA